jgi:hypothetical protein
MRVTGIGVVLLALSVAGCGMPFQSCSSIGFLPGSPEYQRCEAAQASRRDAATRGAVETLRSLDLRASP